jgi:hypothetical protein
MLIIIFLGGDSAWFILPIPVLQSVEVALPAGPEILFNGFYIFLLFLTGFQCSAAFLKWMVYPHRDARFCIMLSDGRCFMMQIFRESRILIGAMGRWDLSGCNPH